MMLNKFDNCGGGRGGRYYYDNDEDGMFSPLGSYHAYGGYPPSSSYQRQRAMEIKRQRAIEAERRRRAAAAAAAEEEAEAERRRRIMYQRAMMEERQQRRAAAAEYDERQQEQARHAEEERRRRQILKARRAEAEHQRQRRAHVAQQQQQQQARTAVMRGPDGRLYRVHLDDDDDEPGYIQKKKDVSSRTPTSTCRSTVPILGKKLSSRRSISNMDTDSVVSSTTMNEDIYHIAEEDKNTVRASNVSTASVPTSSINGNTTPIKVRSTSSSKKMRKKNKGKKQKITITVEDASDSENDDDFASSWRNRRPGPGESWIEPVQSTI
mmetsp:Transcript_26847/g.58726  ORF Transcript_26847/g.58726 Transcript_26847/m.58726 type:complete len:324 (-) Transcript_26847:64-1035(-)